MLAARTPDALQLIEGVKRLWFLGSTNVYLDGSLEFMVLRSFFACFMRNMGHKTGISIKNYSLSAKNMWNELYSDNIFDVSLKLTDHLKITSCPQVE